MYELNNGTYRLVSALEKVDSSKLNILAQILNYMPKQLEQDIQAITDWIQIHRED